MEQTVEAFKAGTPPPASPSPAPKPNSPILTTGNLTVDLHRREARLDDRVLELTPTEFDTLAYFITNAERVVSCRDLVKAVHGYDTTENSARPIMRVHIHRLRQKIEADAANPVRLLTIRSAGYMLTSRPRPQ
jgi:DNA-binding response OmpR family regulator